MTMAEVVMCADAFDEMQTLELERAAWHANQVRTAMGAKSRSVDQMLNRKKKSSTAGSDGEKVQAMAAERIDAMTNKPQTPEEIQRRVDEFHAKMKAATAKKNKPDEGGK